MLIPMRRPFIIVIVLVLLAPAPSSTLLAWGTKEHLQLTRIAAERLMADEKTPDAMRQWLRAATPGAMDMAGEKRWFLEQRQGIVPRGADGLPFWAVAPDTVVLMEGRDEKKVAPFGVPERLLHYVDLELLAAGDQKREYRHDLSGKPKLADIPRDMKDPRYLQAGMLAFRVADSYQKLVEQLRAGRLNDKPGQFPRDEHATKWAGYLAHYLADNTQPQHATIDYKSAAYFADKRRAPNVHAQVEYMMADDDADDHAALREEYWPLLMKALDEVNDPVETADLFIATNEVALASYDALPLIGVAAMAAMKQGGTPEQPQGAPAAEKFDTETFFRHRGTYQGREISVLEMKARQQAWAVKRIERIWRRAWDEAHQPAPTP
ncbi:MAG: hypothetical protein QOF78_2696 [Phycisphaerales bacterium]|jgi:hypothetical protein|nr:hypothetical protein [Phycisphaerales bacterium]